MENSVFFPQEGLDEWVLDGTVDLQGGELTIVGQARRYRLAEAVYVLREVSGAGDSHGLLGRVKLRSQLEEMGAEIVEGSMLLGDTAYDVAPGWIGIPVGTFGEYLTSEARKSSPAASASAQPKTEEDLLVDSLDQRRQLASASKT